MKIKKLTKYACAILIVCASLFSCKKTNGPSITSNFLDYTIPEVPVTADYLVGAFYYTFTTFNANIQQMPTVGGPGPYTYINGAPALKGVADPAIMQQHIADAGVAKIDYFIFSMDSPTLNSAAYKIDSLTVTSFLTAPNASTMNFAVTYNLSTSLLGITNSGGTNGNGVPIEANATKLTDFYNDFKRLTYYMSKPNYQKVNGKYLLIINNAQDLNSNMDPNNPGSDAPLYTQLRANLKALGYDVYIVGMQNRWQPPQQYFYRFQNCTDAMYEANMLDNEGVNDRYWLFAQDCDQNWAYYKSMVESWNLEFVPCIQAAYNYQINLPTSASLSTLRTADGSFYRTYTNIAKRNASKSRLIFLDSFNNFAVDTQVEPTASYGTTYLDITREEFKVN